MALINLLRYIMTFWYRFYTRGHFFLFTIVIVNSL